MNAPIKTIHDRYGRSRSRRSIPRGSWQLTGLNAVIAEQAARHGDQTFVPGGSTSLTYAGFRDKAMRLAVACGDSVRPGHRVAMAEPHTALTVNDITAYSRVQKPATQKLPERLEIVSAVP